MAYTAQTWTDSPSTATPLSAARLTVMENGIAAASTDANNNFAADCFIPGFTTTASTGGTTTLTVSSTEVQVFTTGSGGHTILLPTTGVVAGHRVTVVNLVNTSITVQSSGANTIVSLSAVNGTATFIALVATPTTAAHWTYCFTPATTASSSNSNSTLVLRTTTGQVIASNLIGALTTTATAATTTALSNSSNYVQVFTGSTTQTVTLPTTSVSAGQQHRIINTSTGTVTVNASGGSLVKSLTTNTATEVTALIATPTTNAHWFAA